jgi:D-arabinose 1-dehydrogenase-like Zn-dependent alcohol dehydrogenase
MRSVDVTDWGKPLQQALRETPIPTGTEVLIKVKYCGVCHSDVHIRDGFFDLGGGKMFKMGDRGMKPPVTMGHEPYGEVVSGGDTAGKLPIGQDRLIYPWTGCGECDRCKDGQDNWCPAPRYIGIQRSGGYGDHLIVPDPKYLVDATGIDPEYAPILACSGLTTYAALQKLMPCKPTDWILILGAGGLGLMAIAVLKAMGHENIAVADIDPAKHALARDMGATVTVNPADDDAQQTLTELKGGVWGALDLVGMTQTATLGQAVLRKGGRFVLVGLYGGEVPISLVTLAQRAMTVQGSYVGTLEELKAVVELAKSGKLKPIPVKTCSMDEISETLDKLKAGGVPGRVVARIA